MISGGFCGGSSFGFPIAIISTAGGSGGIITGGAGGKHGGAGKGGGGGGGKSESSSLPLLFDLIDLMDPTECW